MQSSTTIPSPNARVLVSRHLQVKDVPALMRLEHRQWDAAQAASESAVLSRLRAHPALCFGTFCARTGEALASLFMKPVERDHILRIRNWGDCASSGDDRPAGSSRSLFGISLTSVDPQAVAVLEAHVWPRVCQAGWHEIYLGSPMPGLRHALSQEPFLNAHAYAHSKRGNLPRDAQLRYYHRKGLRDIVAVLPGYFPHGEALNYGVLLRGDLRDIADLAVSIRSPDSEGTLPYASAEVPGMAEEAAIQ